MEKFRKIGLFLLFPHIIIVVLLAVVSTIGLIYSFAYSEANPIIVYGSYFLSAYALTIVVARVPSIYRVIKKVRDDNKYITLYRSQASLRVKISLYVSSTINIFYALLQLVLGVINHSIWFYSLAGYYVLLVIMRVFLLKEMRHERWGKDKRIEWLLYRMCGLLLLIMNLALAIVVFYIVKQNLGFEHHYIVTIGMAAYTFTTFTMAIINMVRYKKYNSPVMSASKAISMIAAIVSMLSLETAMLTAFGSENDMAFRQMITAVSGAAVCIAVLVIAIVMIVRSCNVIWKGHGN